MKRTGRASTLFVLGRADTNECNECMIRPDLKHNAYVELIAKVSADALLMELQVPKIE